MRFAKVNFRYANTVLNIQSFQNCFKCIQIKSLNILAILSNMQPNTKINFRQPNTLLTDQNSEIEIPLNTSEEWSLIYFRFLWVRVQSPLCGLGLSFSGFKIPKFFKFEFFRFQKIGPKTRRVFDFMSLRENFDQNLAKMHHFFGKISIVQN